MWKFFSIYATVKGSSQSLPEAAATNFPRYPQSLPAPQWKVRSHPSCLRFPLHFPCRCARHTRCHGKKEPGRPRYHHGQRPFELLPSHLVLDRWGHWAPLGGCGVRPGRGVGSRTDWSPHPVGDEWRPGRGVSSLPTPHVGCTGLLGVPQEPRVPLILQHFSAPPGSRSPPELPQHSWVPLISQGVWDPTLFPRFCSFHSIPGIPQHPPAALTSLCLHTAVATTQKHSVDARAPCTLSYLLNRLCSLLCTVTWVVSHHRAKIPVLVTLQYSGLKKNFCEKGNAESSLAQSHPQCSVLSVIFPCIKLNFGYKYKKRHKKTP